MDGTEAKYCPTHREEMFERVVNDKIEFYCIDCEIDRLYELEDLNYRNAAKKVKNELEFYCPSSQHGEKTRRHAMGSKPTD